MQFLVVGFVLLIISIGEYRLLERTLFWSERHLNFVLLNVEGVLTGYPAGRVFQNRLLGPFLVAVIAKVLTNGSLLLGLKVYTAVTLLLGNVTLFGMIASRIKEGKRLWGGITAVALFGLLRTLFLYDLEYPWDAIDIILFALFGYWVIKRNPNWLLVAIIVIGLFNRETVLFLVGWFIVEELHLSWERRFNRVRFNWRKLGWAVALFVGASFYIFFIRNWLFYSPNLC